jgi:hypothetical protein
MRDTRIVYVCLCVLFEKFEGIDKERSVKELKLVFINGFSHRQI